jgi:hypothetical protein
MSPEHVAASLAPGDRPRDTAPTLVDPTVVDARAAPKHALSSSGTSPSSGTTLLSGGRPSIPTQALVHGRLIFWAAAIVCGMIVLAIALWWLVR